MSPADANPADLHPAILPYLDRHQHRVERQFGLQTRLIETWRSPTEQNARWAEGRNADGTVRTPADIVTNKRGWDSWHSLTDPPDDLEGRRASLAYHLAIVLPSGLLLGFGDSVLTWPDARRLPVRLREPDTWRLGPGELAYCILGLCGELEGLGWGGRWSSPHDWTHFELHPNGATLDQLKAAMRAGLAKVA